jgi:hypothetical protein
MPQPPIPPLSESGARRHYHHVRHLPVCFGHQWTGRLEILGLLLCLTELGVGPAAINDGAVAVGRQTCRLQIHTRTQVGAHTKNSCVRLCRRGV